MSVPRDTGTREWTARGLGVAAGCASMTIAWLAIGWPAPGVSAGLGLLVYGLARGSARRPRNPA